MADSLARLVVLLEAQTSEYQKGLERANTQLDGFRRTQDATLSTIEGGFKKFSRGVHELIVGGGVLIGFRAIGRELENIAQKYKDTNPDAAAFIANMDRLKSVLDQGWLAALRGTSQLIGEIADAAESGTAKVGGFLDKLREIGRENAARMKGGTGDWRDAFAGQAPESAYLANTPIGQTTREQAQAADTVNMPLRLATLKALRANEIYQEEEARKAAAKKAEEEAYKRNQREFELNNANYEMFLDNIDKESKALEQQDEEHKRRLEAAGKLAAETIIRNEEEVTKMAEEAQKKMDARWAAFGDLLTRNLVQAADGGFKAILKSWALTLEQMALQTQLSNFGKSIGASLSKAAGGGGWFGSLAGAAGKLFGFAEGGSFRVGGVGGTDSQLVAFMATPGEPVSVGGGGGTIIQNIDARGAANPTQLVYAMKVAKQAALAEMRDSRKRGR